MGGYLVCFHFLNMASNESKNILLHILFHLPVFISIINISGNGLEIMHTSVIINCIRLTFQNCYYAQINNLSKHIWEYPFPNILASTRCYQYFKTLLIWRIKNDKEFFYASLISSLYIYCLFVILFLWIVLFIFFTILYLTIFSLISRRDLNFRDFLFLKKMIFLSLSENCKFLHRKRFTHLFPFWSMCCFFSSL